MACLWYWLRIKSSTSDLTVDKVGQDTPNQKSWLRQCMHYRQITYEVTLISSDHYKNSSVIVDLAMGQIPRSTERLSSSICDGLDRVGSLSWWVGLGRVMVNGPTDNSAPNSAVNQYFRTKLCGSLTYILGINLRSVELFLGISVVSRRGLLFSRTQCTLWVYSLSI